MRTLAVLAALVVAFIAGAVVYDVWFVDDDVPATTACPEVPVARYTDDELHAAYVMSRGMSSDEASPMWHDAQLERSLSDPVFVAELEAHFCRMRAMIANR